MGPLGHYAARTFIYLTRLYLDGGLALSTFLEVFTVAFIDIDSFSRALQMLFLDLA